MEYGPETLHQLAARVQSSSVVDKYERFARRSRHRFEEVARVHHERRMWLMVAQMWHHVAGIRDVVGYALAHFVQPERPPPPVDFQWFEPWRCCACFASYTLPYKSFCSLCEKATRALFAGTTTRAVYGQLVVLEDAATATGHGL